MMRVYDEDWNEVIDPDTGAGRIEVQQQLVYAEWAVDSPEEGHYETVREYPETGGKDVEWVVDEPERGHWRVTDEDGAEVERFDGEIPPGTAKGLKHPVLWEHGLYVPYTDQELADIERMESDAALAAEQRSELMEAARLMVSKMALTDDEALRVAALVPEYDEGAEYAEGDIARMGTALVRYSTQGEEGPRIMALAANIDQPSLPAEWRRIDVAPDGVRVWVQPASAADGYAAGERVHHPGAGGPVYESTSDRNFTAPGAPGGAWTAVGAGE